MDILEHHPRDIMAFFSWDFLAHLGLPTALVTLQMERLQLRHVGAQFLVQLSHLGQELPCQVLLA